MTRFVTYVIRFGAVILAYAAAALAASGVLHLVYFGWAGADDPDGAAVGWLVFSVLFTALIAAYLAFIPAIVAILVSEIFERRSATLYPCLGASVGLVVSVALWWNGAEIRAQEVVADPLFWLAAGVAGAVAGAVYWAIAGRRAGAWLPRRPTSPAP